MKKKIVGIGIMMLFIATAVLPAVGTMNEKIGKTTINCYQPVVEWTKTYGGTEFDFFQTVRQTADGGYIACGASEENDMFYGWLVKLDSTGTEQWSIVNHDLNGSVMSSASIFGAMDVQQTSDMGYIACGISDISYDFHGEPYWLTQMYLWKLDATGKTQWLKHYYDQTEQYSISYMPYSVIEVENGFVVSGTFWYGYPSNNTWYNNGCLMKFDSQGVKQWVRDFDKGGTTTDSLPSVYQTSEGGYFLSGFTDAATTNDGALWMVKTDKDGNKQWDTLFDGPLFEYTYGKGNFQTNDGGYVMDGVSQSYGYGGTDVWLIKIDSSGNMVWNTTFGDIHNDYCWSMCKADNDGVALGICKNNGYVSGTKDDIMVVETDNTGNAEWQLILEQTGVQITRFIAPTKDEGYIVSAMTAAMGNRNSDAMLVKIKSYDNQLPTKPTINGPAKGKPDKNYTFTASSTDPDGGVALLYRWDWGDGNYSNWLSTAEATHSWTYKDDFQIRVMSQDEAGGESDWSDPLPISIPCSYTIPMNQFWMKLFERFPNAFPLLRQLVGY
ncbi:Uncharacterised protein [uncultured archaeon]|nr:Uncharacterised protein [uncultured archaeon]